MLEHLLGVRFAVGCVSDCVGEGLPIVISLDLYRLFEFPEAPK